MNLRHDVHVLGWLLGLLAVFLALPSLAAVAFGESVWPPLLAAGLAAASGIGLALASRTEDRRLRPRDSFVIVGGAWLLISLFGTVPYLLSTDLSLVDAVFETVSGFTTTGSTVIADVTSLPRALLLWRALTQWLGGMGIILFTIALLPLLGIGGMQLFRAEVPGPVADKVRPRLAATARTLWGIYLGFTALEILLLRLAGLSGFDAVCHGLTTLATGGFSTRNGSIGEFGSPLVEWIIIAFMLVAGVNFVLHFRLLKGYLRGVVADAELRYFLAVVAAATGAVTVMLLLRGEGLSEAARTAAFQVVSVVTTTGYATADFAVWPAAATLLLLALMALGGMSGSTGGGIKSLRVLLAARSTRATIHRLIHPHAVRPVKYAGTVVPDSLLAGVWGFLLAYVMLALGTAIVVAGSGYDLTTAISTALTAIGNVGPGLAAVGPYENFAHFPDVVKGVLCAVMLLGRLEIFTLLVFFSREFWRH